MMTAAAASLMPAAHDRCTLTCADGVFDGLQLRWMLERVQPKPEGGPRKCVLITGPHHLHLVEQSECAVCTAAPAVLATLHQGEMAQYFVMLDGGAKSRHLEFFKRHGGALRRPDLLYLLAPQVSWRQAPHQPTVTYLGVSHLSARAVDDLLETSDRKFLIDCETNRLVVPWETDAQRSCRRRHVQPAEAPPAEAETEPGPKRRRVDP